MVGTYMDLPDFSAVEKYLNSLINYEQTFPLGGARNRWKLEPCLRASARMGLSLRLPRCIHVAGTKGKGSTVAFLEALLTPDLRVLSFTSPHIEHVKERVRLNGGLLSDHVWQTGFSEIAESVLRDPCIKLSYFETVFMFFLWTAQHLETEAHIVEVGLGGRLDATNILEDTISVITTVDYDHVEILGDTLTEIAADKAGIIKRNCPLIIGRQAEEAMRVIRMRAIEQSAYPVYLYEKDYSWQAGNNAEFEYIEPGVRIEHLRLRMAGVHQRDNAAAAIRAARTLMPDHAEPLIRERLAHCSISGRQQLIPGNPDILVDVAHNPISFRALADTLRHSFPDRTILAVVGMMKDKDARASLEAIQPFVHDVITVEVNSPRARSADQLCEIALSLGMNATSSTSIEEAFAALHNRREHALGLVAGSFYLVGDYLIWRRRAGIT